MYRGVFMQKNPSKLKDTAISMYLNGTGKNKIRRILKITRAKLDFWINSYTYDLYKQKTSLDMFFNDNFSREQIIKKLKVDESLLDSWINGYYKNKFKSLTDEEAVSYKKELVKDMYFREGRNKIQILRDLNIV